MAQRQDPDVALLLEGTGIPAWIRNHYQCHLIALRYFSGNDAPFLSTVFTTGLIETTPFLESELARVYRTYTPNARDGSSYVESLFGNGPKPDGR